MKYEALKVVGLGVVVFGAAKLIEKTLFSCGTAGKGKVDVHDHHFAYLHGDKDLKVAIVRDQGSVERYDPAIHGPIDDGSWREEEEIIYPDQSFVHKHSPNSGSIGPYEVSR